MTLLVFWRQLCGSRMVRYAFSRDLQNPMASSPMANSDAFIPGDFGLPNELTPSEKWRD